MFIADLFAELHNYGQTLDVVSDNYCDHGNCLDEAVDDVANLFGLPRPIEENSETIDALLLDNQSQHIAETFVSDT